MAMKIIVQGCLAAERDQTTFKLLQYFNSGGGEKKRWILSSKIRKELNVSCFDIWQFNHERRRWQSEQPVLTGCVKCSRHPKQTLGVGNVPQEKVIAMAASVAAFGLCGSSQDVVGTEVKSSLFKKNKQTEKPQRVCESKQHPSSRGWEPAVIICVGM